mmetsp:Transcript_7815/g.17402  ORF Transcript_7815/g.17402 Transcript_7815/m.17402 type:complete len:214 (-) Transcript_7815:955-1596(-)
MNLVCLKVLNQVSIHGLAIINGCVCKLVKNVVKSRSPLSGSSLGRKRAVIHHKRNTTVVHVRSQGVNGLNHRFVDNFRVGVSSLKENINLSHHCSNVNSGSEGVEGGLILITSGTDLLTNHPSVSSINLTNRKFVDTLSVHDNSSDLISRRDFIVNLLKNLLSRHVGSRVGLLEDLLVLSLKTIVDCLDSLSRDNLSNLSSDGLTRLSEGLFG